MGLFDEDDREEYNYTKGYEAGYAAAKAELIVRCEDCFYYVPEVDDPHKSNCQRLWGGMTECKADSYCSDGVRKDEVK